MNSIIAGAFADELQKIAAAWDHAAEVAGLGILAGPHAYNAMTGKKVKHKTERNTELAGLGVLAAPSIKHLITKHANLATKALQQGVQTLGSGRATVLSAGKAVAKAVPKNPVPSAAEMLQKIKQMKGSYGTPSAQALRI